MMYDVTSSVSNEHFRNTVIKLTGQTPEERDRANTHARAMELLKHRKPTVRNRLVRVTKARIAEGRYDNSTKLSVAVGRLLKQNGF